MANTVVGFTINIEGINTINDLNNEIKATEKALKGLTVGTEEYADTANKLGKLKAEQKALKKQQDDLNKSFLETSDALGAYDKASAKLNKLRKEFKNLAISGEASADELDALQKEIQQLDKTLKNVDGQVGQFQRNVGNYPRTFQLVQRSLIRSIPGFEAFSDTLKNSEGQLNLFGKALIGGFVAFQAANLINRGITQLDEFNKKILETRDIVMQVSGAYGESLDDLSAQTAALAETFDTDAKTIADAAKSISKEFGISFEDALKKVEGALVEGRGNVGDYLEQIKQFPEAFQEANSELSELSIQNKRLLDSNKELAKSQIEVSKETKEIVTSFKEFKNILTSQLIKFLIAFYDALKPIGMAFFELGKAVYDFIGAIVGIFSPGNQAVSLLDLFGSTVKLILSPIQFLISLITGVIETLTRFAPVVVAAATVIGTFTVAMNLSKIAAAAAALAQNIYTTAITAYKVAVNAAKIAQQAFNKAVRANPIGFAVTGLIAAGGAIAAYTSATKESTDATEENTDAMEKEMNALKAKSEAEQKAAAERLQAQQREFEEAQKKREAERAAEEKRKRQQDEYNRALQKLAEDRKRFLADEAKFIEQQTAIILNLQNKTNAIILEGIQDREKKARMIAKQNYESAISEAQKQFDDLLNKQAVREEQAIKLFGANSDEVKAVRAQNAKDAAAAEEQLGQILILERQKYTDELLNIDKEGYKIAAENRTAAYEKQLQEVEDLYQKDLNALERAKIAGLVSESEYNQQLFELNSKRIKDVIALNEQQFETNEKLAKAGFEVTAGENEKILKENDNLFTELRKLEKDYTDTVKDEAAKRAAAAKKEANDRLEATQKAIESAANFSSQLLDIFQGFADAASAREEARFDRELERSEKRQEQLSAELENATGLRRRFLEQQLADEERNANSIAEAKEMAEKRAAKREKAVAIIQSIINTAVAVTKLLANPIAATIAGIAGAAQTAIIAAQPLATGGVVGKLNGEIVQFAGGGKVTNKGNIKPLSNGDNVLATLKTGEVVLNEKQQRKIGYKTLKAANIPGFAQGGLVGAPTSIIQNSNKEFADEKNRIMMLEQYIQATNERFDRLQVVYSASTDDDVEKGRNDRKEIKARASF